MQKRVRLARVLTIVCGSAVMLTLIPYAGWVVRSDRQRDGGDRPARRRQARATAPARTVGVLHDRLEHPADGDRGSHRHRGPRTALSCLLAAPVLMVGARFSRRGLIVGAPISLGLVLVSTVGVDPGYVWRHPESVAVPVSIVVITAAYLCPLVASDVRHRAESALDSLTGALNRRGLHSRLGEIAEQATLNRQPVSLVAVDVDRLKYVNDEFGHASGDLALRQVADMMRESLRTFELLYRVGGDEFLLILPGASSRQAAVIAESLRKAVASAPSRRCQRHLLVWSRHRSGHDRCECVGGGRGCRAVPRQAQRAQPGRGPAGSAGYSAACDRRRIAICSVSRAIVGHSSR